MDNNSFSHVPEGHKAAPQAVYRCGLCLKEFLYYRDLALHERWHLEQMTLERLPEAMRPAPSYDSRGGPPYTAPPQPSNVPITTLDSFDKLVQPFRGDSDRRAGVTHTNVRAPPPTSAAPNMDKLPQPYRGDADSQSVPRASPVDHRGSVAGIDMRGMPVDSRSLALDTSRPAPHDSRNIQLVEARPHSAESLPVDTQTLPMDTRSLPGDMRTPPAELRPLPVDMRALPVEARSLPPDARSLAYSTTSFLDSINPSPLYSSDHQKIPTSTPPAFQVQTGLRPEDYTVMNTRTQPLPKLDSQMFSKLDPYYGMPTKGQYSSLGGGGGGGAVVEKPQPNYAPPSQYGRTKLLGQPPSPYYAHSQPPVSHQPPSSHHLPVSHQPPISQNHPKYNMDKLPSPSSLGFYNQPSGIGQAEPKMEKRQPSPSPKQTLYYGQPPASTHPATMTSSQYQINISKPSHLPFQNTRDLLNKPVAERPEMMRTSYGSGHVSPHLTYSDVYKGSHPHSQVFSPGMQQPSTVQAPVQQNYSFGAGLKAPEQSRSNTRTPVCDCYICFAPFPNMNELSEHMKIHARENIAMEMPTAPAVRPPLQQATTASHSPLGPSYSYASSVPTHNSTPGTSVPVNSSVGPYSSSQQQPPPLHSATTTAFKPVRESQPCQVCGKTFIHASQLAEHVKVHMAGDQLQRYNCRTCSKGFNKLAKCTRHEARHERDMTLFYCEICERNFKIPGNYLYHMTMEHEKVEVSTGTKAAGHSGRAGTIIDCQICDEEIVKDKIVEHLKCHCAHICDKCAFAFEQKTEYVEHLMTKHSNELADSSDAKSSSEISDTEQNRSQEESEDQDSGLEEDHEKDKEEMEAERALADRARKQAESSKKKRKSQDQKTGESGKKKKEMIEVKVKKEEEVEVKKEEAEKNTIADGSSPGKEAKFKFSCSKCDESFERKTALALHVESHVRDPLRVYCEVCNASFAVREKGYYIYHMKEHTDSDLNNKEKLPNKFTCDVCYMEIKRECYISHIVQKHGQFSCDICQWSYSTDKSLFNHMKKIHSSSKVKYVLKKEGGVEILHKGPGGWPGGSGGNKKRRGRPAEVAGSKKEEADQRSPQQTSFSCKVCSREFSKKSSLENHMKMHNNKVTEEPVNCELCNETLPCGGAYLYHILNNHEHYVEPVVDQEADKQNIENKTNCENESKGTNSESKERTNNSPEKVIRTVLNPETGDFEEKEVEEKDNEESAKKETKDAISGIVYCKLCNMSLKRDTLYEHVKEHSLFNCDLCQYSFTKKTRLLDHRKILHLEDLVTAEIERVTLEEEQTNKATETGKRKRTDLIKLYTCPICEAEFRHDKYIEHIKTHRKPVLSCRFCDRKFSKKILLAVHEKSHERISHENELPFARNCPVCNAGILSRANYIEHLQEKHLQHPAPSCKICSKVFISDKILENHTRVHHDNRSRVFWTLDGEGMKFDPKTGRCSEVDSDYLYEIRELNYLMKANRKPEIWTSATPRKPRERSHNKSSDKRQAREADSDEDYVPRKKQRTPRSDTESDDDEDYRPSSKKKKKQRLTFSADDDSSSDEDYTRKSPRRGRPPGVKNKTVKMLRDRRKLNESQRQTPKRKKVLRSDIPADQKATDRSENESSSYEDTKPVRKSQRKSTSDKTLGEKAGKPILYKRGNVELTREEIEKYRPKESDPLPKICPIPNCEVSIFNFKIYMDHFMTHLKEKPYKCPHCDARFGKESNLVRHGKNIHRKDLRKTRPRPEHAEEISPSKISSNLSNKDITCSSPVKLQKVSVKLSPLKQQEEEKAGDSDSEKKYICVYCDKQMKSCWNFSQHIRWHKREMEKMDAESKPFSCKTCGEWFKKKGDLYIHMKVHGDGQEYDGMMDTSKTDSELNDASSVSLSSPMHESDASLHADASVKETSAGATVPALVSLTLTSANNDKNSENVSASNSSLNGNSTTNNSGRSLNNSEPVENNNKMSSSGNLPNASAAVNSSTSSNTPTVTNTKPTTAQSSKGNNSERVSDANTESLSSDEMDHSNNGVKSVKISRNSSVDSRRQSDTESEDKSTKTTPLSVKKMSSESALSKWKAKVMGAMSSQLELNEAKRQEEMKNPVVAKVKEMLTIEGKAPKKNFECRICGDAFDYENFFRRHMEVHLNESPPYCSICDIYFMAIYPKRRLVEHNKKKHPELCH